MVATNNVNYAEQVQAGVNYFQKQAQEQLPLVEKLLEALKSNNLEIAKKAYVESRPPYEQIEVLAGNFQQEDTDIDARPYAFDNGDLDEDFKGFHKIEALVYRDEDLKAAVPYGEGLITSVKSLIDKLNDPSNFNAKDKNWKRLHNLTYLALFLLILHLLLANQRDWSLFTWCAFICLCLMAYLWLLRLVLK